MNNEKVNAGDLLHEVIDALRKSRLPLLSHRETIMWMALCAGVARLCQETEDYTDRKIDLLETEIKIGASRLQPDTIDAPYEED